MSGWVAEGETKRKLVKPCSNGVKGSRPKKKKKKIRVQSESSQLKAATLGQLCSSVVNIKRCLIAAFEQVV